MITVTSLDITFINLVILNSYRYLNIFIKKIKEYIVRSVINIINYIIEGAEQRSGTLL